MEVLRHRLSRRRWCRAGLWGLAWLLAFGGQPAVAADDPPDEYKLKAAVLFNFAQFAEWPAKAFANAKAPIVIGVLGENPFGTYLDELLKGEKFGGRPLAVRYYRKAEEALECHMLFISRSETAQFEAHLAVLRGHPILTIGDADTFIRRAGGMVRFMMESGKVRFAVNLEEIKAGEISISSKIARFSIRETKEKN